MAKVDYDSERPVVPAAVTARGGFGMQESKAEKLCERIIGATNDKDAKTIAEIALPEDSEMLLLAIVAVLRGAGFVAAITNADERRKLAVDILCGKTQIAPVMGWFVSGHINADEALPSKDAAISYADQLAAGGATAKVVQRALWTIHGKDKVALVDVCDFPVVTRWLAKKASAT